MIGNFKFEFKSLQNTFVVGFISAIFILSN